ncbi:MAG: O-methyltransferase, partial [Armatimonadetes bacterium]|nr:O-methyltransferase [Candidatus Hippobium faecium]
MNYNKLYEIRQYAKTDWVPILKEDTQFFLEDLLKKIKPKTILEVGTAIGFSSLVFSEVLCDNVFIDTIEIDESRIKTAEDNIKSFGKTNI